MSQRFSRVAGLIFSLALLLLAGPSQAQNAAPGGLTPLGHVLNHDGSLNVPSGFSGSLNARGYRMVVTGDGSPRFMQAPSEAMADGDENWDDRFGIAGFPYGQIHALAKDGDVLYAGGWFQHASNLKADKVARWDGRAWSPLGAGIPDGTVYAMVMYEGDLYVGGSFTQAGDVAATGIARWNGTVWETVGEGGLIGQYGSPTVYALAVFNGALYAAGDFSEADGVEANGVAKWDGTAWSALGTGLTEQYDGKGTGYALAASPTALYVGGYFAFAGGQEANSLAAWNGTAWSTAGSGLEGEYGRGKVKALAVQGSKVYAGGEFEKAGGVNARSIAVFNAESKAWTALGQGVRNGSYAGEVQAILPVGSDVYVAGNFVTAGSSAANYVAKWNGSAWSALVESGRNGLSYQAAHALAPGPDGSVFIGGSFSMAGASDDYNKNLYVNGVAQWTGTAWKALGEGVHWGNGMGTIYAVAVSADGKVYVGGQFHYAGSALAENIAMWDGQQWHPLGSGVNQFVYAIATRGNEVFVGGRFTQAGGTAANYIAKWDADARVWSGLGSGTNGYVHDLAADARHVYAVGDYTAAGGVPAIDMARWDGTSWSKLGAGIDFTFNAYLYSVLLHDGLVYLGGDFHAIKLPGGSAIVNGLLAWEEATDTWYAVGNENGYGVTRKGSGSDTWGIVNDIVVAGNQLYVGGKFDKVGGQVAANGVGKFDFATKTWSALGTSIGGDYTQEVHALVVNGPDLFVGGRFTSAGGVNSQRVARWSLAAQSWSGLGRGMEAESDGSGWQVYDLATYGNKVFAGGLFEMAGGRASSSFAQWTTSSGGPVEGAVAQIGRTSVNFGEARAGQSLEHTFTIANAPEAGSALVGSVSDVQTPFEVTSGTGAFNLAPGQSHLVTVRFEPQTVGAFSGSLVISHNAANVANPANVSLMGTGVPSSASVVLREFDPQSAQQPPLQVTNDGQFAGYAFGTNTFADRAKGTALRLPGGAAQGTVSEVKVWFAHKKAGLTNQTYTLRIYDGTAVSGPTGQPLFSQSYRLADVNADADPNTASAATLHALPQPVRVGPSFVVVVDFGQYEQADFDMAAIATTDIRDARVAEAWEQWSNNQWANASDVYWGTNGQSGTGTKGVGLWIEATALMGTSTPNEQEAPHGSVFNLEQNAPNPFGAATSIRFTLPATGHATLKVYDALGREVATLVDGQLPAGPHTATLDAAELTSGMYFYTLRTGQESRTRKMIIVR